MADASSGLTDVFHRLGIESDRFKTGTPCRVARRSIDFERCTAQESEEPPTFFGFLRELDRADQEIFSLNQPPFHVEPINCWITHTTAATHEIIRSNLDRSALYAGRITGVGPRYCPSIEDKVVKFCEKSSHQIFLEPEGLHSDEFYVNGLSTSLPSDVQHAFVRTVPGLKDVEVLRPGYAVEYDYFPPTQLAPTLESKVVPGLFFAGQVNGTSGYEEAAAQGLVAGANAANSALELTPFKLNRSSSYIGVLIDDLVTHGTDEPYRMFTSRSEDRLVFRHDNADQRLTPLGRAAGLVSDNRWKTFSAKLRHLDRVRQIAETVRIDGRPLASFLRQPDFVVEKLPLHLQSAAARELWDLVATDLRYEGYVRRQKAHDARVVSKYSQSIPPDLDFRSLMFLRPEARQRLSRARPDTLGEASRTIGVTPADVSALHIYLRQRTTE